MKMITEEEENLYNEWWMNGGKDICETSKERSKYVWGSAYRMGKQRSIEKNGNKTIER